MFPEVRRGNVIRLGLTERNLKRSSMSGLWTFISIVLGQF